MKFSPIHVVPVLYAAIAIVTTLPMIGSSDGLSGFFYVLWAFPGIAFFNWMAYDVGVPLPAVSFFVLPILVNVALIYGFLLPVRALVRRGLPTRLRGRKLSATVTIPATYLAFGAAVSATLGIVGLLTEAGVSLFVTYFVYFWTLPAGLVLAAVPLPTAAWVVVSLLANAALLHVSLLGLRTIVRAVKRPAAPSLQQ